MRVGDLVYLPRQHRFAAFFNRYCWEDAATGRPACAMRAGLHFDGVLKVQAQHVRQDDPEAVAGAACARFHPRGRGGRHIDLLFAGGGCIRLSVECIDAALRDMTEPWPAMARPEHDVERP